MLDRWIHEEIAAGGIDIVTAPRVPLAVDPATRRLFPLGFRRQAHQPLERVRQPAAVRGRILVRNEHDGVAAVAGRRFVVLPDVGQREILEDGVAPTRRDERQPADGGRRMASRAHEAGVVVARHGKASDEELADVHAMNGAFVVLGVGRAHQEVAGGNARQIRR